MTEISDRFPLAEVDHQELIEIFTLRYGTCWRVAERQIAFPAHRDHQLRLELRHGQIIRIWAGNSLSDQELDGLLDQIEADLKDKRIAEFGAEILFAHRPVQGGFRFKAIPIAVALAGSETSRNIFQCRPQCGRHRAAHTRPSTGSPRPTSAGTARGPPER
jgi:hypothetical protein